MLEEFAEELTDVKVSELDPAMVKRLVVESVRSIRVMEDVLSEGEGNYVPTPQIKALERSWRALTGVLEDMVIASE